MITTLALLVLAATTTARHTSADALKIDGQTGYHHTYFLGIGVDAKRQKGENDRLAAAVIGLQQVLQKNCSQEPGEPLLLESHANAAAVTHALTELADPHRVHPDDRVIVDLVCHGDDTHIPRFLLAPDKTAHVPSELSMATLQRLFRAIPARHKLLIVDGCRAGAMLEGGGRFDGATDYRSALTKPCCVIWSSSQSGANAVSESGGTFFHNRLIEAIGKEVVYGQTVQLSRIVDRVERRVAPAASFGAPTADLILAGPESKQAPPIDPRLGRQEPLSQDAEGARRQRQKLQEQIKTLVRPDEAELLRQSLAALQQFKTVEIASELPGALQEGARALVVFTLADHPEQYMAIHRSLAYLCMAVGEWKPDREMLSTALEHRQKVVDGMSKGEGVSRDRIKHMSLTAAMVALADAEESAGELGDILAARNAPSRYRKALEVYTRAADPADWAATQNNLATALRALGEHGDLTALKESVERYKLALEVRTRAAEPAYWAATQNNLAIALKVIGERGDLTALKEAIERYKLALEVYTRAADPADWALIQNNMAGAVATLGKWSNPTSLKEAVEGFKLSLEVYTRAADPAHWAMAQNNLAVALRMLGEHGDLISLKTAVEGFKLALEIYTREADPAHWAGTQNNLAITLATLGERGDLSALKAAVERYKLALEVRTRAADPVDWATTQNNLANALTTLGELGDSSALKEAVERYKLALEVRTRAAEPVDWAMTQNNLANALQMLGELGDLNSLKTAVERFKLALEIYTRAADPVHWAGTQNNLANALAALGEHGDLTALKEAVERYKLALEVRTRAAEPEHWAATQNNLAIALRMLGEHGDLNSFKAAVEGFKLALEIYTREADPVHWAMTQSNLAGALAALGERGDLTALKESVERFKLALEVRTIGRNPAGYAQSETGLGFSLKALGQKTDAAQAFRMASEAYRSIGQSGLADRMAEEANALK